MEEKISPVVFNYLGQLGSSVDADWSIFMNEETGVAVSPKNHNKNVSLEINGIVNMATGKLELEITSFLEKELTHKFTDALGSSIEAVVDHACQIDKPIKTPSDFCAPKLTVERLRCVEKKYSGDTIQQLYAATSLQQALIAHAVTSPDDDAYTTQYLLDYKGNLDVEGYEQAWDRVIKQYPTFRSAFDWEGEEILLVVLRDVKGPSVEVIDLRDGTKTAEDISEEDRSIRFDLSRPPLVRFKAMQIKDDHWTVLLTLHHAIFDGWSMPIMLESVTDAYLEATGRKEKTEFVEDTAFFNGHEYRVNALPEARKYWSEVQLGPPNDLCPMLNDAYAEATDKNFVDQPAETTVVVEPDITQRLKSALSSNGITMNIAVNFAWHKLLQVYTHDDSTIVGLTVSGREMMVEGIEKTVGMFINTLPFKTQWVDGLSSIEILKRMQTKLGEITSHSQIPLSEIVKANGGEKPFNSVLGKS